MKIVLNSLAILCLFGTLQADADEIACKSAVEKLAKYKSDTSFLLGVAQARYYWIATNYRHLADWASKNVGTVMGQSVANDFVDSSAWAQNEAFTFEKSVNNNVSTLDNLFLDLSKACLSSN